MHNKVNNLFTKAFLALAMFAFQSPAVAQSDYDRDFPSPETPLNDIPGDMPLGEYIQNLSSSNIAETVVLTNGVLTVGTNSISISPAKHTVITTNETTGVISTNTYNAVFEDQMNEAITISTNALNNVVMQVVVTNWIDSTHYVIEVQTITNHIAYTYDVVTRPIDPDDRKADKVLDIWDFLLSPQGITLKMEYVAGKLPEVTKWKWTGGQGGYTSIEVGYNPANQTPWYCITNEAVEGTLFASGTKSDKTVSFNGLTFFATNFSEVAFVVYSDFLASNYVDRADMGRVAGAIDPSNIVTVTGIKDTLLGIKTTLLDIAGGNRSYIRLRNVAENTVVRLGNTEILTPGDIVEISWGDGTGPSVVTNFPVQHTYTTNFQGAVTSIELKWQVRSISGDAETGFPWITVQNGNQRDGFRPVGDDFVSMSFGPAVGIIEFGDYAFAGAAGIEDLTFVPQSVVKYGKGCFKGCSNLQSLTGMSRGIQSLPEECFRGTSLQTLNAISPNVGVLGKLCFADCSSLINLSGIEYATSLSELGEGCFRRTGMNAIGAMSGLTNLGAIPDFCFSECTSLIAISLSDWPRNLNTIGAYAFASNILNRVDLPMIEEVSEYAFAGCQVMSFISVPYAFLNGQTVLRENAFYGSGESGIVLSFTNATIRQVVESEYSSNRLFPWGVSTLGNTRFVCRDGYLDNDPITWSTNYQTIAIYLTSVTNGAQMVLGQINTTGNDQIHVDWGDGTLESRTAQHTLNWNIPGGSFSHQYYPDSHGDIAASNYTIKIYGSLTGIESYGSDGFVASTRTAGNPYVTLVQVGNAVGISQIGDNAFSGCYNMTNLTAYADGVPAEVTLPETVTSFGENAFADCENLHTLDFVPSSLASMGTGCFNGCTALESIEGLSGTHIVSIPNACFSNCVSIASLAGLPETVESIGQYAFAHCDSITTLEDMPTNVVSIGEGCFLAMKSLLSIEGYPSTMTTVPAYCFSGCSNLTSLVGLPIAVTEIGKEAFAQTYNISDATLSSSVTELGEDCFEDMGMNFKEEKTDDYGKYNSIIRFNSCDCNQVLGAGIQYAGVPALTRIYCTDGVLVGVAEGGITKWVAYRSTLKFNLDIPANAIVEFRFASGAIQRESGTTVNISWGDGTSNPVDDTHSVSDIRKIYTNDTADVASYTVTMSGYITGISGEETATGRRPFFFSDSTDIVGNPFLTSFDLFYYQTNSYHGVSRLGDFAFYGCTNLTSLVGFSHEVANRGNKWTERTIPFSAYDGRSLEGHYVSSVNSIGRYCFSGCTGLTSLKGLPDVDRLSDRCFEGCSGLLSLSDIPSSIKSLGEGCFFGCTALPNIRGMASTGVVNVPISCFEGCTNLSWIGYLSSLTTNYSDRAFAYCVSLKDLLGMDNTVKTMNSEVFRNTGLTNLVGMSQSIALIPPLAFEECFSLENISGASTNTMDIGQYAFYACTNMTDVNNMPANITNFQRYSFAQCFNLTNGVMGSKVVSIGDNFMLNSGTHSLPTTDEAGITSYTRIFAETMESERVAQILNSSSNMNAFLEFVCSDGYVVFVKDKWIPMYKSISFVMENVKKLSIFSLGKIETLNNSSIIINWGDNSVITGKSAEAWTYSHKYSKDGNYTVELKGFIKSISATKDKYPFLRNTSLSSNGNTNITKISVGEASMLETLGDYCLKGCPNITTLNGSIWKKINGLVSSRISVLGRECFADCTGLLSLVGLPISISELGYGCFSNCTKLASVRYIPETVKTIPPWCFSGCSGLTGISLLPPSIIEFGTGCFRGCTNIRNLEGMPDGSMAGTNITINSYVFADCKSLSSIEGYSGEYLTEHLFDGCTHLRDLRGCPSGISEIPDSCFKGCIFLTNISAVAGIATLEKIGSSAFFGCSRLTSLDGLSYVKKIDSFAFSQCNSLVNLEGLTRRVSVIGEYAFATNTALLGFGGTNDPNGISYADMDVRDYAFSGCPKFGGISDQFFGLPDGIRTLRKGAFSGCDMQACLFMPTNTSSIQPNLFSYSNLSNLTIYTGQIGYIADSAFSNERNHTFMCEDLETSRFINFPNLQTDTIKIYSHFPWGASKYTRFYGSDGYLVNHANEWLSLPVAIYARLVVRDNSSVSVRINKSAIPKHGNCVAWGDGHFSYWIAEGATTNHIYQNVGNNTNVTLMIMLPINSIGGAQTPFINCGGGAYVNSISFNPNIPMYDCLSRSFFGMDQMEYIPDLPNSTTNLADYCFANCRNLKGLPAFPETITAIGRSIFEGCTGMTNAFVMFPPVSKLPDRMFFGCTNLEVVCIADMPNLKSIGSQTFGSCSNITSFVIPYSVTTIGSRAFSDCPNMGFIGVPVSVSSIGSDAFAHIGDNVDETQDDFISEGYRYKALVNFYERTCINITNMIYSGDWGMPTNTCFVGTDGNVIWENGRWVIKYGDFFLVSSIKRGHQYHLIYEGYPGSSTVVNWGDGSGLVTNLHSGTSLRPYCVTNYHTYSQAFDYAKISIRGKVKRIYGKMNGHAYPFFADTQSPTWSQPDIMYVYSGQDAELNEIGDYAFAYLTGIDNFDDIAYTYTKIGDCSFMYCTGLVMTILPQKVKSIGTGAFVDCSHLQLVLLPDNRELTMGSNVFARCFALETIQTESDRWPKMNNTLWPAYTNDTQYLVNTACWSIVAKNVDAADITNAYRNGDYSYGMYGLTPVGECCVLSKDGTITYKRKRNISAWWLDRDTVEIDVDGLKRLEGIQLALPEFYVSSQFDRGSSVQTRGINKEGFRNGILSRRSLARRIMKSKVRDWQPSYNLQGEYRGSIYVIPASVTEGCLRHARESGMYVNPMLVFSGGHFRIVEAGAGMFPIIEKPNLQEQGELEPIRSNSIIQYPTGALQDLTPEMEQYLVSLPRGSSVLEQARKYARQNGYYVNMTQLYEKYGLTELPQEEIDKLMSKAGTPEYYSYQRKLEELGYNVDSYKYGMLTSANAGSTTYRDSTPVTICWGDGTSSQISLYCFNGYHQYTNNISGKITIKIKGQIASLKRRAVDQPFLTYYTTGKPCRVTRIRIGDGVGMQSIDEQALCWYTELTDCTLPDTMLSLGNEAFKGTGISTMSGMPYNLKQIGDRCFVGCTNLKSLASMPTSVVKIGNEAFAGMVTESTSTKAYSDYNVESLIWGTVVNPHTSKEQRIGLVSLSGMQALSSVTNIGEGCFAFTGISSLQSFPSSQSITAIPNYCFYGSKLSSLSGLPSTVKTLGAYSLSRCDSLVSLSGMGDNVTSLGTKLGGNENPKSAIWRCANLSNASSLSANAKIICPNTFSECPKMSSPQEVKYSVSNIYDTAYNKSKKLVFRSSYASELPLVVRDSDSTSSDTLHELYLADAVATTYYSQFASNDYIRPLITIRLQGVSAGETVFLGKMIPYDANEPIIISWGENYYSYITNPTNGIGFKYEQGGDKTITVCGFIEKIGKSHNGSSPFVSIGYSTENSKLISVNFNDVVGIHTIEENSFLGCPNMNLLKCDQSVDYEWYYDTDNAWRTATGTKVYSHLGSYTTSAMPYLNGYPWGIVTNNVVKILGIDGEQEPEELAIIESEDWETVQIPSGYHCMPMYEDDDPKGPPVMIRDGIWLALGKNSGSLYFQVPKKYYGMKGLCVGKFVLEHFSRNARSYEPSRRNSTAKSIPFRRDGTDINKPFISVSGGAYNGTLPMKITTYRYTPIDASGLPDYHFYNCIDMTKMIDISTNVVSIGSHSFENTKIGEFGTIPSSVTNIGERAFASSQLQNYHIAIEARDIQIGENAFGDHYPFGVSQKTIEFINKYPDEVKAMSNFPFASMMTTGAGRTVSIGYTNETATIRCRKPVDRYEFIDMHPVYTGDASNPWEWVW